MKRRLLLKLSGQSLGEGYASGFSPERVRAITARIRSAREAGAELAIVVGGGNFFRGAQAEALGLDRSTADGAGMLATVMNALCVAAVLRAEGIPARALSSFELHSLCEPFRSDRARECLDAGEVLLLAGGTGNPYFTTDTAATLKALEVKADMLIKATRVDGVYDADPEKVPTARRFETLTFDEVIERRLGVMDQTAFTLAREHKLPIIVLDVDREDALIRAVRGESVGTLIKP